MLTANFWKRGIVASAAIFGLVLISALGRSIDTNKPATAARTLPDGIEAPFPVRDILQRSCLDCHSGQTNWPWYSKIPPVSWQIKNDVASGREAMDFSQWSNYSPEERRSFAIQIAQATNSRFMPPPKYLWLHPEARLSDADREALKEWARNQAK